MNRRYYLTCKCGEKLAVRPAQAGMSVQCRCGALIKVPSLRELAPVQQPVPPPCRRKQVPIWGRRQSCFLVGLLLSLVALAGAAWIQVNKPKLPDVNELSLLQTWVLWQQLRQGTDRHLSPSEQAFEDGLAQYRVRLGIMTVFPAIGILIVLRSSFIPREWSHDVRGQDMAYTEARIPEQDP